MAIRLSWENNRCRVYVEKGREGRRWERGRPNVCASPRNTHQRKGGEGGKRKTTSSSGRCRVCAQGILWNTHVVPVEQQLPRDASLPPYDKVLSAPGASAMHHRQRAPNTNHPTTLHTPSHHSFSPWNKPRFDHLGKQSLQGACREGARGPTMGTREAQCLCVAQEHPSRAIATSEPETHRRD